MFDPKGNSLFEDTQKINVLAKRLLHSLAHCRDNELFVLFVDLVEQSDQRGPLIQAIRVAVARHHQVVVVCPWPNDLPVPSPRSESQEADPRLSELSLRLENLTNTSILLRELSVKDYYRRFKQVRDELVRLRVPILFLNESSAIIQLLDRIERLRMARPAPDKSLVTGGPGT